MILGAIAPLAIAIGWGMSVGFSASIRYALANYLIALVMTALIALIVDLLAPQFGGTKDFVAALKLSAFSYTAAFLAGIFHLLGSFGGALVLIAMVYAYYTFYLGAPVLKKCSEDKALVFTIIVVVIGLVLGMLFGVFASSGGFGPRMM
jgi:hypothetical protein